MTRRNVLLPLLVILSVPASLVRADVVANAKIKWDTWRVHYVDLSAQQSGMSLDFDPSSLYGYVYTEALTADPSDNPSDDLDATDFTTDLHVSSTTLNAQSTADRTATTLSAHAATQNGISSNAPDTNWAYGYASNEANYTLSGYGLAIILVDWELDVTGTLGDANNAVAGVYMYTSFDDGLSTYYLDSYTDLDSYDVGTDSQTGTLSLTISSLAGGGTSGYFWIESWADSTSANVPEPASCVLFGLGLGAIGFVGYRRRAAKR